MSISNSVRRRLQHDLEEIEKVQSSSSEFKNLSLTIVDDPPSLYWKMRLFGARGTYWQGQAYDFEIHFGRNFPFEPPRLHFPSTPLNSRGMRHPAIGRNGNLELDCVSKDNWNCSWSVLQLIREANNLFTKDPEFRSEGRLSSLLSLSEKPLFDIVVFLPLRDILCLSETCKKALVIMHSNSLWARLYYARCQVPPTILYGTGVALQWAGPGPVREWCTGNGRSFQWRYCREAYIRAHQCFTAIRGDNMPSPEVCAANELALLLPVAFPADLNASQGAAAHGPTAQLGTLAHHLAMGFLHTHMAAGTEPTTAAQLRQAQIKVILALQYRCVRSARLAQWLGGSECIRGNVLHNYWGNIPVTTLIFLSSLVPSGGRHRESLLDYLASRMMLAAQEQADAAQDRVAQLELEIGGLQQEMGDLLHSRVSWAGTTPPGIDVNVAGAGSETDDVDKRKTGGKPIDADDDELASAPEPEEAALHKLQWIEHLLADNAGRPIESPWEENCGNFAGHRWQASNAGVGRLYGPDLYDLVEILHELNTAFSARFREFPQTAKLDCQDANGDWVVGAASAKVKFAVPTPPVSLFSMLSKPADEHLGGRARYVLAQIALRDQRRLLRYSAHCPSAVLAGAAVYPTAAQVHSALERLSGNALKATSLKPPSHHRGVSPWMCISCGTVTSTRRSVCGICKTNNPCRLSVSSQEPDAQVFVDTLVAHSTPSEQPGDAVEVLPMTTEPSAEEAANSDSAGAPGIAAVAPNLEEGEREGARLQRLAVQENDIDWEIISGDPGITFEFFAGDDMDMSDSGGDGRNDFALAAAALTYRQSADTARTTGMRQNSSDQETAGGQPRSLRVRGGRYISTAEPGGIERSPVAVPIRRPPRSMVTDGQRCLFPVSAAHSGTSASQHITAITHVLQGNNSPYLSFSVHNLNSYFRQLCNVLCQDAKGEENLASSYRNFAQTLAAEDSSRAQHPLPAGTLEDALRARMPTTRGAYWEDVANNLIYHYGRSVTLDEENAMRTLLTNRVYNPFHLSRNPLTNGVLTVHFPGFDQRFDESIDTSSARLAPYRTHTSRPMTMQLAAMRDVLVRAMDETNGVTVTRQAHSVGNLVRPFDFPGVGASSDVLGSAQSRRLQSQRLSAAQSVVQAVDLPAPAAVNEMPAAPKADTELPSSVRTATTPGRDAECVDILLRCLWLISRPGGGAVRYKVPAAVKLQELVLDYCAVLDVPTGQVRTVRLDMFECVRYVHQRSSVLRSDGEDDPGEEPPVAGFGEQEDLPGVQPLDPVMTAGELGMRNCYIVDLLFTPSQEVYTF